MHKKFYKLNTFLHPKQLEVKGCFLKMGKNLNDKYVLETSASSFYGLEEKFKEDSSIYLIRNNYLNKTILLCFKDIFGNIISKTKLYRKITNENRRKIDFAKFLYQSSLYLYEQKTGILIEEEIMNKKIYFKNLRRLK
jgi:hypothetical protein